MARAFGRGQIMLLSLLDYSKEREATGWLFDQAAAAAASVAAGRNH